jgi:hypothetical protein
VVFRLPPEPCLVRPTPTGHKSRVFYLTDMAKDAFWFRHDANARNDIKIIDLRAEHGYQGYGIYFAILEVLREQDGYKLPISKSGRLAVALGENPDIVRNVVDTCIECGLFVEEEGYILSPSFIERMAVWEAKKLNGSKPKAKSKLTGKLNANIREENNREEEIREEKNVQRKRFTAPSVDEVFDIMGDLTESEKFVDYYTSKGWMVGKAPMKDWKSAVRNWKRNVKATPDPYAGLKPL